MSQVVIGRPLLAYKILEESFDDKFLNNDKSNEIKFTNKYNILVLLLEHLESYPKT